MTEKTEQTEKTPEQEKQAQTKRIILVLVFGTIALLMFYYMANGVTSLLTEGAMVEPMDGVETTANP